MPEPMYKREEAIDANGAAIEEGGLYAEKDGRMGGSLAFIDEYDEYHGSFVRTTKGCTGVTTLEMLANLIPVQKDNIPWAAKRMSKKESD